MSALAVPAVLAFWAPDFIAADFRHRPFSLEDRFLTQLRVLWQYLGFLLLPNVTQMGFFHDDVVISRSLWTPLSTVIAVLAWPAVIALAYVYRRACPLVLFALLFFLAGHILESTVLPLEMVFEHRNYLPGVGVCLMLAWALLRLTQRVAWLRPGVVAALVLMLLAGQLAVRSHAWRSELSLAEFNVRNHPLSQRGNFYYGKALFDEFQHAVVSGADAQSQALLAASSRDQFLRAVALDQGDVATQVMLLLMDVRYFPGLAQRNDRLAVIEQSLATRPTQASDRSALKALARAALASPTLLDVARITRLVDEQVRRRPGNMTLLGIRYRLNSAAGADKQALAPLLQQALKRNRTSTRAASYLAQYHSGKPQPTYEALSEWLRRDTLRRELGIIEGAFDD